MWYTSFQVGTLWIAGHFTVAMDRLTGDDYW
ncbi:hypothetical protein JMJ77_0008351 [Colletotrichum scovillei]|uniref:Uncharacterized protein n=1 Tax=Colletotrichum scovillei TaxID=1209932 RepID=A0A9P7ULM0_9PEZI|nr:hypothetical protein JMJ77_0008351 [Colletotrichum scovillei]KAG7075377.1 hypothetical protein JMJ76_0011837 [Colletotrichum scovillei]KAG7082589.1 hypothetical protein JMJ78_0004690 [Colletotrichum scovillei]